MIGPLLASAAALAGSILVPQPAAAETAPVLVGYAPAFRGLERSVGRDDIGGSTHINIAFANPDPRGLLVENGSMTCMPDENKEMVSLDELKQAIAAFKAAGAKVLVSVAGGVIPGCSGNWETLLAPEQRPKTVANLLALVDETGLDGLDVDIEGVILTAIDKAGNFTPFIAELSRALKKRGKLLTTATASYEGGMIPVDSVPYFDLVNIMSYDAIGPSWGPAGAEHSPYEAAARDIALWRARGVAKERLVLGVPFYGYGFGGERSNWTFKELVARDPAAAMQSDVIGDACADCTYVTFNGLSTIRRKAELASREAGGVMVWEVTQDSDDGLLLRTIREALGLGQASD